MPDMPSEPLPSGMRLLTWGGVLPFVATWLVAAVRPDWRAAAEAAFIAYGAVILSFLGGARWGRGLALRESPRRFVEAVLPSLVGFAALLLLHAPAWALAVLAVGFATWLHLDLRDRRWPTAYRSLRLQVSVVVLLMHAAWWLLPMH